MTLDYYCEKYNLKKNVSYRQKTGRLLEHRIGQLFAEWNFETWINSDQSNGVDLKVWDNENNLIIVSEILNWGPRTNLSKKRRREIIANLSEYRCHRVLIYTQIGNEQALEALRAEHISTIRIGYQIVSRYFYEKLTPTQIAGRKIDSRETTLLLKSRLKKYLDSIEV